MDAQVKARLVGALRSGEFKQATGTLHEVRTQSYCCLGVLCKVMGAEFTEAFEGYEVRDNVPVLDGRILSDGDAELLSAATCSVLGITEDQQVALMHLNDGRGLNAGDPDYMRRHSFPEIADYIEANL